MAKVRLSSDTVFSIGGNALTCVISVNVNEAVDVITSDCDDANSYKEQISGGITAGGSVVAELEKDDVVQLGYIDPKTSGAWIFQPNGTTAGDIKYTATTIEITSRDHISSRGDKMTYNCNFILSDVTIAANPA